MHRFWIIVRILVAAVALVQTLPAQADEQVISDTDPSVQVTGPWQSGSPSDGSTTYLYRGAGGGSSTVFWPFPGGLSGGQYQVFTRWVSGPDRASNATYWVASDDGTQSVSENQQTNGNSWQSLGSFQFEPGKGEGVTLTDNASGVVVADSVRWVGPSSTSASASATPQATAQATSTQTSTAQSSATPAPSPTAGPTSTAQSAAAPAATATTGPSSDPNATWTVTLQATDLHAGPDASTDKLASVPQFSYLQVLGYQGDWAYVYNPRARGTAYAESDLLGPSDPPPAWVTAPPPPPTASIETMGRTVGKAPVAFYPVDDKFAYTTSLGHNVPILVHDKVQAADGSTWYRTDQGYLAASSVRLPRPPPKVYSGRWLDADLQEPAMLTAYNGSTMVMNTLAIKGTIANQTPTGVFTIQRRVQDETMDSGTLGIDPHGPGGYHLEHVLYTQYFTS